MIAAILMAFVLPSAQAQTTTTTTCPLGNDLSLIKTSREWRILYRGQGVVAFPEGELMEIFGGPNQRTALDRASTGCGAWPLQLTEQVLSVRRVLEGEGRPVDVAAVAVARKYQRAPKARIESTLATLAALGHARALPDGRSAPLR